MDENNIKLNNEMIIILDKNKRPLGFTSERRAKQLLKDNKAVVHSIVPFVIRHKEKDARECTRHEFKIKIDPGSKETGIAITDLHNNIYFKATIIHKGQLVVKNLETRHGARRNRRNRETRYRRCKFPKNGKYQTPRPEGWLPPSIVSIEQNIINWVKKLMKYVNIVECSVEEVAFDLQKMDNPDIKSWEYQHDTKEGKTIRAYLLNKTGHTCQYCGGKTEDPILEVEHMIAKANGGTDKLSNLTIACHKCNQEKGNRNLDAWLNDLKKSDKDIDKVRVECVGNALEGKTLKPKTYAAWVNSYKNRLIKDLESFNFRNLELSDGVTTQMNRIQHGMEKQHYNDAACIGNIPNNFKDYTTVAHIITAIGRGNRLKGQPNCCGILNHNNVHKEKTYKGFQTGDICKIAIPRGKYKGNYVARISIRHSGTFMFKLNKQRIDFNWKHCTALQRNTGYDYNAVPAL